MVTFEETRTIRGATPEEVFDFVADPDQAPRWMGMVSEASADGEPRVGRRITARASLLGVHLEAEQEVTVCDRPNRYGWGGAKPFPTAYDWTFTDTGSGGTRVDLAVEVEPRGLPGGAFVIRRTLGRQVAKDLDRLRDALER